MKHLPDNILVQIFITVSLLFWVSSCDVNDIFNKKNDKEDTKNTTSIGINGGTITKDDLTISIPAGAFEETSNIVVSISSVNHSSMDIVTGIYSIEGLPDKIIKPIKIELKSSGTLKEKSYLVFEESVYIPSLDTVKEVTNFQIAKSQNGILTGEFQTMNKTSTGIIGKQTTGNSVSGNSFYKIFGISNQKSYVTANNHFKIIYNPLKDNISNITNLGQYLEDAYSKIEDLGFNFSRRTSWPIKVQIEDLQSNEYGFHCTSLWGINSYYLKFNRTKLNETVELKTTAIHEFFHFVQYLYDSRNVYSRAKLQSQHHWFNEACSVWSEELVAYPNYISDVRTPNTLTKPFQGLQAGSVGDATYHGYGMSAFVKYLVGKYGKNILVSIYNKIFSGRHVVDAINNSINYNLFIDYTPFLEQYAQGKIYNDLGYDRLLAIREGLFTIATEADTIKSFKANYKELSAKLFLVRLDNQNFQDGATLNLSVDKDMCDISVFEYPKSGGKVTLLAKGQKNCVVTGLNNLVTEGKYLIVMVTNSNYTSNNYVPSNKNITLKIVVAKKQSLIGIEVYVVINDTEIRWKDPSNEHPDWVYTSGLPYTFDFSSGVFGIAPHIGSWNFDGNVFNGTLDNTHPDEYTQTGNIKITFLDNPKRINLEINRTKNAKAWPSGTCKEYIKLNINNIPALNETVYREYGSTLSRAKVIYTYQCTTGYSEEIVNINFTGNGTNSDDGQIGVALFYR